MMVANDALKIAKLEGKIEAYKEVIEGLKEDLAKARQPLYKITCEPNKIEPSNPWTTTYGPGDTILCGDNSCSHDYSLLQDITTRDDLANTK